MKKFLQSIVGLVMMTSGVYAQSITSSGAGPNIQFRGTRATSTQSLTSSTTTKIQLNTIGIDTGSYWDGTNFYYKPLVAGTYEVCGSVYIGGTSLSSVSLDITKNGTSGSGGTEIAEASNTTFAAGVSNWGITAPCTLVVMNGSTDTIEEDVTAIGTSPVVNAVRSSSQMTIRWVSP